MGLFDTIIGSEVARKNGWDIGSQFYNRPRRCGERSRFTMKSFSVVAVLASTGTANDRTVFFESRWFLRHRRTWANRSSKSKKRLRDFYASDPERLAFALGQLDTAKKQEAEEASHDHGHDHGHAHVTPDAMKEVTAILVKTRPQQEFPKDSMDMIFDLKKGFSGDGSESGCAHSATREWHAGETFARHWLFSRE